MPTNEEPIAVEPGSYVCLWSPTDGFAMLIPDQPDDTVIPDDAIALMGAFMRLVADANFRRRCIRWMHEQKDEM